jgi:diguanylate cyclase (GGDEF)-like protein
MRIRDRSGGAAAAGVAPRSESGPIAQPAASQLAQAAVRSLDVATIMGIPETELTPKVRVAIDRLMAEVQSLREELARARRRVDYLEQLADRDPLAPVLNRRAFVRELTRMIAFAERYGVPGSVLYFDMDGMKRINDTWGHAAGDAALLHVAEILLRDVRSSDIVGRLGGDEFGIILAQADAQAAAAKAESLAEAIAADPFPWHGAPLELGVSCGVYSFAGGEAVHEALNAADRAMYARKRNTNSAAE